LLPDGGASSVRVDTLARYCITWAKVVEELLSCKISFVLVVNVLRLVKVVRRLYS